jgi:NhaP-type Na+/H+ or K+/H+ antiporter
MLVVAIVLLLFGWVSRWLDRSWLTPSLVFLAVGAAFGPHGLACCSFFANTPVIDFIAELTLVLILFSDASRISLRRLRSEFSVPLRLLGIGLPLTMLLGTVAAKLLFPELEWFHAALLGTILAPTDAALGQAVITSPEVPVCTRQSLNVESGLNDGIALPAVLFFAVMSGFTSGEGETSWVHFVALQLTLGPVIGIAVGAIGAIVTTQAIRRGAIDERFLVYSNLALALVAYGLAQEVGGNGFIAAFVSGLVVGSLEDDSCECMVEFTENEGQLLMLLTFLLFGATYVLPAIERADAITWSYVALSLTIVRMLPVGLSLLGTGFRLQSVLFIGWFGPRGLASILFGLMMVERAADGQIATEIFDVVIVTVAASALLHGLSARPFAALYGAWVRDRAEVDPELSEHRPAPDLPLRQRPTADTTSPKR